MSNEIPKPEHSSNKMSGIEALNNLTAQLIENSKRLEEDRINWLQNQYKSNEFAQRLLDYLAFSDAHYKVNSVKFLEVETNCDYYGLVKFLKKMDSHGLGKFMAGRKGKDTRIIWTFHPKNIGAAASHKTNKLLPVPKKLAEYDGGGEDESIIQHSFSLRPDLVVDIILPSDFSKKDADRLSRWLNTIPFD